MNTPLFFALVGLFACIGNIYCIFTRRLMGMVYINALSLLSWTIYSIITNQIILAINILLPAPMLWISWKQIRAMRKEQDE